MNGQGLTEEQKRKIEENRQKALTKRVEKLSPTKKTDSVSQKSQGVSQTDFWKIQAEQNRQKALERSNKASSGPTSNLNENIVISIPASTQLRHDNGGTSCPHYSQAVYHSTASQNKQQKDSTTNSQINTSSLSAFNSSGYHSTASQNKQHKNSTTNSQIKPCSLSSFNSSGYQFTVSHNKQQKDSTDNSQINTSSLSACSSTDSHEYRPNEGYRSEKSTPSSALTNSYFACKDLNKANNCNVSRDELLCSSEQKLKGRCLLTGADTFSVEIGFSAALVEFFKTMATRNYDVSSKNWSFKLQEYNIFMKGLKHFQPYIEIEGLPHYILHMFGTGPAVVDVTPDANLSHVDEKIVQTLLPFQREGVNLAIHRSGRLLIADDMGLGKTLQAICIAHYYRREWPLLIVAPSSVRFAWSQQICKWLPSVAPCDVNVVETGKSCATSGLVNIISYDLLSKKSKELKEKMFKVIIMDESHFLKNSKTVRTKAALPLVKGAKRVLLLSGTPALSRPSDLFSQIIAVCPALFKFREFGMRYCNAKQMSWGWDYSGSSNMIELQLLLEKKVMIRRQKKDVLSQLPSKTRQMVVLDPLSIEKHKDLNATSKLVRKAGLKGMDRRGALLQYFHETAKAKMAAVRDYILYLIEADKKFLVFAHHKEMLDCIEDCIKSQKTEKHYIRIDGRTTSEQRNFFCNRFQTNDSIQVAILSITAANAGLNLSAASVVVFAELFWNPGILVQAEDRAHRIGQQDSVSVQYLVAQGTADDFIWPLIQDKLNVLSKAGLTKDNFSDAETTRVKNSQHQSILNIFSKDFLVDSAADNGGSNAVGADPNIKVNVDVEVEKLGGSETPNRVGVKVQLSIPLTSSPVAAVKEEAVMWADESTSKMLRTPRNSKKQSLSPETPAKRQKTPSKMTPTKRQKTSHDSTPESTPSKMTPTKRQVAITNFFLQTPRKSTQQMENDVSSSSSSQEMTLTNSQPIEDKNGHTYSSSEDNDTKPSLSNEDLLSMQEIDWNELM